MRDVRGAVVGGPPSETDKGGVGQVGRADFFTSIPRSEFAPANRPRAKAFTAFSSAQYRSARRARFAIPVARDCGIARCDARPPGRAALSRAIFSTDEYPQDLPDDRRRQRPDQDIFTVIFCLIRSPDSRFRRVHNL
ncbi:MAG: hypothetical protein V4801_05575 [Burkholderia gladioli]